MILTRRDFGSKLGLLAAAGGLAAKAALARERDERARPRSISARDSHASGSSEPERRGPKAEVDAPAHKVLTTPEEIWADLLEGNKRFQAGKPAPREFVHRREELAKGQHP